MKKKVIFPVILLILTIGGIISYQIYTRYFSVSYTACPAAPSAAHLSNPYRGWYRMYGYTLSDSDELPLHAIAQTDTGSCAPQLALLEINLRNYRNVPISNIALTQLDALFDAWTDTNKQLIVRFLYDWNGQAKATEPDELSTIKEHMTQVADSVNRHKKSIYLLQGIFVGNCGEMNNSNHMSKESMTELIEHLSSVIDSDIFLAVRTPAHWRIANRQFTPLEANAAFDGSLVSRLGLFNDGMLGSGNDLGTYGDTSLSLADDFSDKGTRAEEIDFQNSLCKYVPNGGEVVLDNPYNDFSAAVTDLTNMHVSYLNCDYDRNVLNKWQNSTWNDSGCFYNANGYDYIGEHLGYRYTLSDSYVSFDTWHDETAKFTLMIENSGFSNCLKRFDSVLTLVSETDGTITTLPVDTDNRFWNSASSAEITVSLPIRTMTADTYRVFFKLHDSNTDRQIQFANDLSHSMHGYEIGTLSVGK